MANRLEHTDTLTLPSGRTLAWTVYGGALDLEKTARPTIIFYFHSFPGSATEARCLSRELLHRHDARCVALDRPGVGISTHDDERRILDWPDDVLAVADHLRIAQFYVLGVSGGAPYALACASAIPRVDMSSPDTQSQGRLRGVAVVSGIYPTSLGVAGMLPELRALLASGAWLPRFATGAMLDWTMGRAARHADPHVLEAEMDRAMAARPAAERAAWANANVRSVAVESLRGAFRQGGWPLATELMLLSDWGFRLQDLDGKGIRLWHGQLDRNVPCGMAEKAAELMTGCQTHFFANDGHLSMSANHMDEIVADLLRA
ncbi:uncharacterized protein N7459_002476 [Penicillium hispanicum]|uniref:uncharacterized protein n=1 Tax=Penicillium hispanicum TaxID=1080232 RepID=UPI002541AAAF|nr:uncharacterized protein N7459_002476 [Penicillium hispanicum]KAJ5586711.1 hypothetical protein N7459_002476 [Penicillium hispanicum]